MKPLRVITMDEALSLARMGSDMARLGVSEPPTCLSSVERVLWLVGARRARAQTEAVASQS